MALFNINTALKQEFRQERKIIFGNKRYLLHIALWIAALIFLLIGVFGDDFNNGYNKGITINNGHNTATTINGVKIDNTPYGYISIISAVVGAIMVYLHLLIYVPYARYKKQRRYLWLGVILNIALWITAIFLCGLILGLTYHDTKELADDDYILIFLLSSVFSGIIAGFFFSLYYFLDLYDQQKNLNLYRKVLIEKLEAETNFLKMQINPHFLFNTLNNIYSLTLSQSPDAAFITRQLKDLVTYMLYDCTLEKVPLSGEIVFLKNYINLEQLRNKQEQINIELNIKGNPDHKEIAPLLLINFIENAFKHGVKSGIDHAFVKINLMIMDNILAMDIVNSKPEHIADPSQLVKENSGIGIHNVRRRLAILYPGKHKLRISESQKEYSVYLTIDLNQK